jgi:hypothetical protein
MTGKVGRATAEDQASWIKQMKEVYEAVLGKNCVAEISMRPTLPKYLAFDVFTLRRWR